jgi:hypothetical protein
MEVLFTLLAERYERKSMAAAPSFRLGLRGDTIDDGRIRHILLHAAMRRTSTADQPLKSSVTIGRLSLEFDGKPQNAFRWAVVDLEWDGLAAVAYLNLFINGRWSMRNAPVFGSDPAGVRSASRYYVALPILLSSGDDTTHVNFAHALTYLPIRDAPRLDTTTVSLFDVVERYYSNIQRKRFSPLRKSPGRIIGKPMVQTLACRRDVPNQDCGKAECGPAAASNSLLWLRRKYNLRVDEPELTIDKMKDALAWTPNGVPNGQWADAKENYIRRKKLPFTSRKFPGAHVREATGEFANGQAVEVFIGEHIATLICMGQDASGNYWINAASDTKQGAPGGTISQPISISPDGIVISGPPWARQGEKVQNFVIQCPQR